MDEHKEALIEVLEELDSAGREKLLTVGELLKVLQDLPTETQTTPPQATA